MPETFDKYDVPEGEMEIYIPNLKRCMIVKIQIVQGRKHVFYPDSPHGIPVYMYDDSVRFRMISE